MPKFDNGSLDEIDLKCRPAPSKSELPDMVAACSRRDKVTEKQANKIVVMKYKDKSIFSENKAVQDSEFHERNSKL